jgi:hypothetical protein
MWWEIRFLFARVSGAIRRRLGLALPTGRTLSEVMYDLERDPTMRECLRDARKAIREEDRRV